MKKFFYITGFIVLAGCGSTVDISEPIPGAYFMKEQIIKDGDERTSYKDLRQLKIYSGSHFMFTQINPRDSSVSFGVGRYELHGDTLKEYNIYASTDSSFDDSPKTYSLLIEVTPEAYNQRAGYNQTIKDFPIGGNKMTLVEYYNKATDTLKSPLDGVWRELNSYMVVDGDTLPNERTQYKAFFRGHFMFGNTVQTGADGYFTGMGYGTFKSTGDGEIEETDLHSSYPFIAGNTFKVSFKMDGADRFTQTVQNADGSIGVENYERVK